LTLTLTSADAHYQTFLQTLEAGPELLPSAAVQREQQEKAAAASGGAAADNGAVKVSSLWCCGTAIRTGYQPKKRK